MLIARSLIRRHLCADVFDDKQYILGHDDPNTKPKSTIYYKIGGSGRWVNFKYSEYSGALDPVWISPDQQHTCPGRARNTVRLRTVRRAGTVDGTASRARCGHCRADTRTRRNPCGPVAAPVPSSPGTGTRAGISGNTSRLPASRAAAIRPTVRPRTGFGTGRPTAVATPRPLWRPPATVDSLATASRSPVKRDENFFLFHVFVRTRFSKTPNI